MTILTISISFNTMFITLSNSLKPGIDCNSILSSDVTTMLIIYIELLLSKNVVSLQTTLYHTIINCS